MDGSVTDRNPYLAADGTMINAASARIDPRKLVDYSLNDHHSRGGHKASVLKQVLGFDHGNVHQLERDILAGIRSTTALPRKVDEHGSRFTVDLALTGPTGRSAVLRTNWIYGPNETAPRMTSAFVRRRRPNAKATIS